MKTIISLEAPSSILPKTSTGHYCPSCGEPVALLDGKLVCEGVYDVAMGNSDITYCQFEETEEQKALTKRELIDLRLKEIRSFRGKLEKLEDDLLKEY